jgi:hypothetical protein
MTFKYENGYYTIRDSTFNDISDGMIHFTWCDDKGGRFVIGFGGDSQWFYLDKDGKFVGQQEGEDSLKNVVEEIKKYSPELLTFHEYHKK